MEVINWNEFLFPYELTVEELMVKFNNVIKEYIMKGEYSPIESVSGRVKKVPSILEKSARKLIPDVEIPEKIEDIAGIRLICQFEEDIPKVVDIIRKRDGKDLSIVEERDYITNTKPSGYRSYHIIVRYFLYTASGCKEVLAEIQIRTLAMNFWATTEHTLKYKYSGNIPQKIQKRLVNCAEAAKTLDMEMATIRSEIMDAERQNGTRSNLVTQIIGSIQSLYIVAGIDEVNRINREFVGLWEKGDIEKLKELNDNLNVLREIYRV